MSDNVDAKKAQLDAAIETDKLRAEVQKRDLILKDARTKHQIETLEQNKAELEKAASISFNALSGDALTKIKQANSDYIHAARNSMSFMNDEFKGIIPYFQKNLIFIGGKTGEGKSTTVANIAFSTLKQINPQTSKTRKVLVITNEEKTEDVYNRVTCLVNGWSYTNHDKFTDEQVLAFEKGIDTLSTRMVVIDDSHEGAHGLTTSIEGICQIFDNLIRDKIFFDAVIIDYYQNIKHSKTDPGMDEFKVQAKLAAKLDIYKNIYPAPIILMAQVNPPDKEDKTPFQFRIKGRKIIMDVATCAIEMVADRENYRTQWTIHKSRFNESVGKGFWTGFSRGRYVSYDNTFIMEVARLKENRMLARAGVATKEDKESGSKLKELMEKDKK